MNGWQVLRVCCGGPQPTPLPASGRPRLLVFPADADGEALAGAIAVQSGAAVVGRITALREEEGDLVVTRSTHGGRLALELRVCGPLAVATANDTALAAETIDLGGPAELVVERAPLADQRVSLEGARIVLGGGRGLDDHGFALLEAMADALGGAVGASLAAVDLGLAPVARQVGQSGKFVNPSVYLAAGMSGTPQHFAGVGARARIIAVNTDAEAPVFMLAQVGIHADARLLLPEVARVLAEMEGKQA